METTYISTIPAEDEIVISLIEQKTVIHDTVRINLMIRAQRDETTEEATLRSSIRAALNKFISGVDWRFTNIQRTRGATRFEEIVVSAVARAPESENRQLADRANAVSVQGLELINPTATYSLPHDKVREINRDLRVALAKQAGAECALYNEARRDNRYRVALIEFADTPRLTGESVKLSGQQYGNTVRASAAYGQVSAANITSSSEPDVDEGSPDLGVSERFWVGAQVTLRAKPLS